MSLKNCQNLAHLALKYLKYLRDVQTSTIHTSKAYANDLEQFLEPLATNRKNYRLFDLMGDNVEVTGWEPIIGDFEKGLMELVRAAQSSWAPLKPSSKNRKIGALKSFFNWLYQEGYCEEALAHRLISPSLPKKLPNYLSVEEAESILRIVQEPQFLKSSEKVKIRLLFLLLYGGGLRVSEACLLKWRDFKKESSKIFVQGKGQKERVLSLPPIVSRGMIDISKKSSVKPGHFILGSEEKPLSTRKAYSWIKNLGSVAGLLRPISPHSLRHSYATHLLVSGASIRIVQELLGHKSLGATEKYLHLDLEQIARSLENCHPLGEDKK